MDLVYLFFYGFIGWQVVKVVGWFLTKTNTHQSIRRKLCLSTWDAPASGEIYGQMMIPMAKTWQWAKTQKNADGTPARITITHLVIKAIGLALRGVPHLNSRILFDKIINFERVDVGTLVAVEGGNQLANAKICDADKKSVQEIAADLGKSAGRLRTGADAEFNKTLATLKALPPFIIRPLVNVGGWVASALGLDLPQLGVRAYPFGSCIVTSIGMLGLDQAYVPFTPFARVPVLIMVGQSKLRPTVNDDGEIVAEEQLCVSATFDHRFMDGTQGGQFAKLVADAFANPERSFVATPEGTMLQD